LSLSDLDTKPAPASVVVEVGLVVVVAVVFIVKAMIDAKFITFYSKMHMYSKMTTQ